MFNEYVVYPKSVTVQVSRKQKNMSALICLNTILLELDPELELDPLI